MRTKPARSDAERIRAFHEKLRQPSIVEIDDATAYWLEGPDSQRIGDESPTSEAPLLAALAAIQRGVDPMGRASSVTLLTMASSAPADTSLQAATSWKSSPSLPPACRGAPTSEPGASHHGAEVHESRNAPVCSPTPCPAASGRGGPGRRR
jgi:hypothetical protein